MIELNKVSKIYKSKNKEDVVAVNNFSLKVEKQEFVLIKGESGCGKTTSLFLTAGMLTPDSGTVNILDTDINTLSESEKTRFRAHHFGFVFQAFHLIPYLTVNDNIRITHNLYNRKIEKSKIISIAEKLNIAHRLKHLPSELSIGEKQRTALARALITTPDIILADEPTGNLDKKTSLEVIRYFEDYIDNGGTVVMVTHSDIADNVADKTVHLKRYTQLS